ncbi:MAG: glutamate--tRNA ligase [Alphaproteobacteria bacterium]|nr:glutamate--tRNA ligase [Alphaproteobacteria bacterium]
MAVVTRFAPSPTGFLHIGGARTALFNWLYARHHGGTFLLRIEDTDRARSTQEAVDALLHGLTWLGLDWDGEPVFQFSRQERHAAEAHRLVEEGKAYFCFASPDELTEMREKALAEGRSPKYDRRWRDRHPDEAPKDTKPVIRLKAPTEGATTIVDRVQGEITVQNSELDDFVLLRADGTPTYMLAVVVDDHDMGVTHVVRGDDHTNNAFRQTQLFQALGYDVPTFAHVPLIHGQDGAKMSKRHGAIGVDEYDRLGYLPEAMRNYLLRLGWSHGDDEIISTDQAIDWFDLDGVGKSAARFDLAKLDSLNAHYIKEADNGRLLDLIAPRLERLLSRSLTAADKTRLLAGMDGLKQRAKTLIELAEGSLFYVDSLPLPLDKKAAKALSEEGRKVLGALAGVLSGVDAWSEEAAEAAVRGFVEAEGMKFGAVAQPLRAAVSGTMASPALFEMLGVLGKEETLARMTAAIEGRIGRESPAA